MEKDMHMEKGEGLSRNLFEESLGMFELKCTTISV